MSTTILRNVWIIVLTCTVSMQAQQGFSNTILQEAARPLVTAAAFLFGAKYVYSNDILGIKRSLAPLFSGKKTLENIDAIHEKTNEIINSNKAIQKITLSTVGIEQHKPLIEASNDDKFLKPDELLKLCQQIGEEAAQTFDETVKITEEYIDRLVKMLQENQVIKKDEKEDLKTVKFVAPKASIDDELALMRLITLTSNNNADENKKLICGPIKQTACSNKKTFKTKATKTSTRAKKSNKKSEKILENPDTTNAQNEGETLIELAIKSGKESAKFMSDKKRSLLKKSWQKLLKN